MSQSHPTRLIWTEPMLATLHELYPYLRSHDIAEGQVDRHEPEQRGTGFFLTWTRRDNASGNQTARQGRSG